MAKVYRIKGKQRWDMNDEATGRQIRGAKIFINDGQLLNEENKVGEFDTSFGVAYEVFDDLKVVPGDYELEFEMKVGSKSQFVVSGVRYVGKGSEVTQK